MEYLNFELRIAAKNSGRYPVTVIRSPAGETSAMATFPVDDPLFKMRLQGMENSRGEGKTRKASNQLTRSLGHTEEEGFDLVKTIGSDLFGRLFSTEIRSCFRSSLQRARQEKKGLRILLRVETPDLAALPWEYLYDEVEGDYFCLSSETPLVRFPELARPLEALTIVPPLRILCMVASPKDLPALDVESEKALLNAAVEHLIDKGFITITWLEGQGWRHLQAAMRKGPWHVFHFTGHGAFDTDTGEGILALVDDEEVTYRLSADNLGRLLADHQSMRLVILNSCEGARTGSAGLFSSTGANLIRRGIPAVISMQYKITDRAALEFCRSFYETIAEGNPVDTALQEARKTMRIAIEHAAEWGTPVLHMRAPDGILFDMDVNRAIFPAASPLSHAQAPTNAGLPDVKTDYAPSNAEDRQGLNILMNKVNQFWVQGVLEQSLQHSALIELGLDNMPNMVDSPWGSLPITAEQSIMEVFNEVGRSLLLLGEPGAGKTTMMLSLTRELLQQYQKGPELPLPVVVNLSSWTYSEKAFSEWLTDELSTKYMIPRMIGKSWLEDRRLLLMLDGLDEVRAERRNGCVQAINHYLQAAAITGVVVCCRFKEYIELDAGAKLKMNGAIRLRLLSKEKIMNYLKAAGEAYSGLSTLLKKDSSFMSMAETPFMLSLMMRTYRDIKPDQLMGREVHSINARKKQLMEAYVKKQFRMAEKESTL